MIDLTRQTLEDLLIRLGTTNATSINLAQTMVICLLLLINYFLAYFFRKFAVPAILKIISKTETNWDDYLINQPVLNAISHLFPCVIVYLLLPLCYDNSATAPTYILFSRLLQVYITICSTLLTTTFLKNLSLALNKHFEEHHLTGILQFLRLVFICLGCIVSISLLFGNNPLRVIAGLGAAATVLMLVFKDSILGLVAGIQLSLNKMLKVGDWITIKKLDIDGCIEEISLTTVKVRNFDNTISTVPPYTLVSDAFQNWDAMVKKGARRVKRALYIDIQSIRQLSVDELDNLKREGYLTPNDIENNTNINLTLLRHYLHERFKHNNKVVKNQWVLFRLLSPTPNGLPLETWFYTSDISFDEYEDMAANSIEYIISILPEFKLKLFQSPTGTDLMSLQRL